MSELYGGSEPSGGQLSKGRQSLHSCLSDASDANTTTLKQRDLSLWAALAASRFVFCLELHVVSRLPLLVSCLGAECVFRTFSCGCRRTPGSGGGEPRPRSCWMKNTSYGPPRPRGSSSFYICILYTSARFTSSYTTDALHLTRRDTPGTLTPFDPPTSLRTTATSSRAARCTGRSMLRVRSTIRR